MDDTLSERKRKRKKGLKEGLDNVGLESGLGQNQLDEQPAHSERKRKRKKELKEGLESVVELRDRGENSLIGEKQRDSHLQSGMKGVILNEQPADSERKRKTKKERELDKAQKFEELNIGSESLDNIGLESGLRQNQLNEQPAHSERKQKRKKELKEGLESVVELRGREENSLIDEKKRESHLQSGMKGVILNEQLADSERKRKSKERKLDKAEKFKELNIVSESLDNIGLESGLRQNLLNEQPAHSERKQKRKKELKEGLESVVELRGREENSLIGEKQRDSQLQSGMKGVILNEQSADSERKRKSKKEHKLAKAKKFEELNQKSVVELRDGKQSSLLDKQSDSLVDLKLNVSLESGLKEGEVSLMKDILLERDSHAETSGKISLESGLNRSQLNEQLADSKRKRKRKHKMAKDEQIEKLDAKSALELRDRKENFLIDEKQSDCHVEFKVNVSLESVLNEGANPDLGALENISLESGLKVTQFNEQMVQSERKRKGKRGKRKKSRLHVLEDNEAENNNKGNDSPRTASTSMVKTHNLHADGSLLVLDIKDIKTLQEEKTRKTYHRKRKGSSNFSVDSLEHVQENGMIPTSIDHIEKEHTIDFLENGSDVFVRPAMLEQAMDEAFGNSTGSESMLKGRKRKKKKKLKESLYSSLERVCVSRPKKKLLVLDMNGILVDVVEKAGKLKPDIRVAGKGVFKRPFCDDFLDFCFRTFNVGIWSSRISKNLNNLVSFLMQKWRNNLLFCWDRKYCTITKFKTLEDRRKPLVLKELRKLWEKHLPTLQWEKGEYDESNTLLLDDSPYKALLNPANTAVFPYPYQYTDARDSSLACKGDIRKYLEGLAAAENVQKYVEQNPFGQPAITESNPHWGFYRKILNYKK